VLFKEAQRQRAYRTLLLVNMMPRFGEVDKSEQAKLNKGFNELLNPYTITKAVDQKKIDSTWDMLRGRS